MSIKVMSLVWDKSKHKDTPLLLLLAIADYADDDGYAWPSIETLQKKIRVDSPRTVHYNLKKLVDSGELSIQKTKGGRSNTHGFQIDLEALKGAIAIAGFKKEKTLQSDAQTLQSSVLNPAIAIAPEPSLTVIEPSNGANAPNASLADSTKPKATNPISRTDTMSDYGKSHDVFCLPASDKTGRMLNRLARSQDEIAIVQAFLRMLPLQLTESSAKTNLAAAREIIEGGGCPEDVQAAWKESRGKPGQRGFSVTDLHSLKGKAVAIAAERRAIVVQPVVVYTPVFN